MQKKFDFFDYEYMKKLCSLTLNQTHRKDSI